MLNAKKVFFIVALAVVGGLVWALFTTLGKSNISQIGTKSKEIPEIVAISGENPLVIPPGRQPAGPIQETARAPVTTKGNQPTPAKEVPTDKSEIATGSALERDPFKPYETKSPEAATALEEESVDLVLQGIWGSPLNRYAIINDDILKVGDKIYNYLVKDILKGSVVLKKGDQEVEVSVEDNSKVQIKVPQSGTGEKKPAPPPPEEVD